MDSAGYRKARLHWVCLIQPSFYKEEKLRFARTLVSLIYLKLFEVSLIGNGILRNILGFDTIHQQFAIFVGPHFSKTVTFLAFLKVFNNILAQPWCLSAIRPGVTVLFVWVFCPFLCCVAGCEPSILRPTKDTKAICCLLSKAFGENIV